MVTKVKLLRIEDEETGREREIACANEAGEEMVRLCVDGERLGLKYDLEYTIEDREDEVDGSNSRCGDPFPLKNKKVLRTMANSGRGDPSVITRCDADMDTRARTKSFRLVGSIERARLKCIMKRFPGTEW